MGCSASRPSSTRSGTVRPRCLGTGLTGLPLPAPIPPLALFGRQQRIARLLHRRRKDILAADVDSLSSNAAELPVKRGGIFAGQLLHTLNTEKLKIAQHGRADRDEILQTSLDGHK